MEEDNSNSSSSHGITKDFEDMHPWNSLKTVTTFDLGNNMRSDSTIRSVLCNGNNSNGNENNGQIIQTTPSPSALIISLIQQLCKKIETDKVRRNKLYYAICDRMHELELIDSSYNRMEFESARAKHQRALCHLFNVARATIGSENIIRLPSNYTNLSRYDREFHEVCFIASGGFGEVYKAVHCLDGVEYAIKKIHVHPKRLKLRKQQLKEVKTLAKLNHTNIVSYKAAWIEPELLSFISNIPATNHNSTESYTSENVDESKSSNSQFDASSPDNKNGLNINDSNKQNLSFSKGTNSTGHSTNINQKYKVYDSASKRRNSHDVINKRFDELNSSNNNIGARIVEKNKSVKQECVTEDSSDIVFFQNDSDANANEVTESKSHRESNETSSSKEICPYSSSMSSTRSTQYLTLYIQMALCEQSLKEWMSKRCNVTPIPVIKAVFEQIIRGLDYIHSQEIVHHDIKPSNIFISTSGELQIHLGDFGLACPKLKSGSHSVIGTPMYAAPEQMIGQCNPKSDIYSSGIVLAELLIHTDTRMELIDMIECFKNGTIPQDITAERYKWAQLVIELIKINPVERPCTKQLLQRFYNDKDATIATLTNNLNEKEYEIKVLKEEIALLKKKCKKMEISENNDIETVCDVPNFDKTVK